MFNLFETFNRLNDTIWLNGGDGGGSWSKEGKCIMPTYFSQVNNIPSNMRTSSSPSTTLMNNNSQDLYAEVSDVTVTSGLLSTFNNQHAYQNQSSGDLEPYATTTLAMQNTNARIMVCTINHNIIPICFLRTENHETNYILFS